MLVLRVGTKVKSLREEKQIKKENMKKKESLRGKRRERTILLRRFFYGTANHY
jgi:predicted GIY-YIG superfamily endonuclease